MELLTDELAGAAGLRRYEIANLARPGHESRHNLLYWRRRPYLAIGPGAHAFDGARRRTWNAAPLDGYLLALAAGRLPPGGRDEVDEATALAESAILGLRLVRGHRSELARPSAGRARRSDWARELGLAEDVGGTHAPHRGVVACSPTRSSHALLPERPSAGHGPSMPCVVGARGLGT